MNTWGPVVLIALGLLLVGLVVLRHKLHAWALHHSTHEHQVHEAEHVASRGRRARYDDAQRAEAIRQRALRRLGRWRWLVRP